MIQEVALTIANQSTRRFDQIGLGIQEVNDRIAELRANNRELTRDEAFQEAVISTLIQKYGALTTSAQGQATGIEKLSKSWKDLRLEIGQAAEGPVNAFARGAAFLIDSQTERLRAWMAEVDAYIKLLRMMGMAGP